MNQPLLRQAPDIETTLRLTRLVAGALAVSSLVFAAVSVWIHVGPIPSLAVVAAPSALLGLVSPVIGYRLFQWQRDRRSSAADRCAAYARATFAALAVTDGIAFLGIVVQLTTRRSFALVGVLTHVLLTGAIWPTREKIEDWIKG